MSDPIKLKPPVTPDGIKEPVTLTPEQIEAKRLADEKAANEAKLLELKDAQKATIDGKEYLLDKDGNAYNIDGSLFKKKDELSDPNAKPAVEPLKEGEEIEIEANGVTTKYKIDKDGNAIAADGKVFKTKDELAALLAEQTIDEGDDPFEIIQETLQFKPTSNGQPVVYEKTTEGLKKLAIDAATEIGQNIAKAEIQKFFDANPDIQQMRTHKILYGNLGTYVPQPDWNKVNISELDDDAITQIILQERKTKGDSDDTAKYFIEGIKKDGKLKEFGTLAIKYLSDKQTSDKAKADLLIKDEEDKQALANAQYWERVNNALTTKKVEINGETFVLSDNFTVKESDGKMVVKTLSDFNDYISKVRPFNIKGNVVNMTQNQYELTIEQLNRKPDNDVFEALRRFLRYDDSQLVAAKAKHDEIKKVRKLTLNAPGRSSGSSSSSVKLVLPVRS